MFEVFSIITFLLIHYLYFGNISFFMLLVMLLFKLYFFTLLLILDKDASLIKVILYRIFSAKADNLYLPILPIS
jgi:hypothetical protein